MARRQSARYLPPPDSAPFEEHMEWMRQNVVAILESEIAMAKRLGDPRITAKLSESLAALNSEPGRAGLDAWNAVVTLREDADTDD